MKHFRKIWDEKKNKFLIEHKNLKRKESYKLFLETFSDAYDITFTAFCNQRSKIGAVSDEAKNRVKYKGPKTPKALFSEHEKKGYIRIKIGQPNKWMFKHHYIWWIKTGHKPKPKEETVLFLDGNNRNFEFENLFLMPRKAIAIFNNPYLNLGIVKGNAELTKINAMNAIFIYKIREIGKKYGLVYPNGTWKDDIAKKAREKRKEPEQKEKNNKKHREYYQNIKKNNPEKYQEIRQKHKEYMRTRKKKK